MKLHFIKILIGCLCLAATVPCAARKHKPKHTKVVQAPMDSKHFQVLTQSSLTQALGYYDYKMETNGELRLMKQVIKPGSIVFDVGANVGDWSLRALSVNPSIQLFSFEPLPLVFDILKQKLQPYGNAASSNLALSEQKGRCAFYFYDQSIARSSAHSGFYNREILRSEWNDPKLIEVEQDSLENFCADHSIDRIDFLKIDTEGAEWRILKGAESLLQHGRIGAIQFEYGGCYLDAGATLEQAYHLLTSNNYLVFRIVPSGLLHIALWDNALENYLYSNYFAVLKSEQSRFLPIGGL